MKRRNKTSEQIEYYPPSKEIILELAKRVSETLAAETQDPSLATFEVVHGLADFITLTARIQVKHLNRGHSIDNSSD